MKEEKTISTHVSGNDARTRQHNKLEREEVTDNEPHSNPNGYQETLVDESTVDAYHRLFDPAVEEYNARQTRADRKIKNYYAKVEADPRKHTCYEMTVCVGNKDNPVDRDLGYTIMREYVEGWQDRNPNLELIGAYYHANEEGAPSLHLDFIPVGHGFKNGPSVQAVLSRALVEQGFGYVKGRNEDGLRQTPQIQWERSENDTLETICNKYGVKVEHPESVKNIKHPTTSDYKELRDEVQWLNSQVKHLNEKLEDARLEEVRIDYFIKQAEEETDDIARSFMSPDMFEAYIKLPLKNKMIRLIRHISDDRKEIKQLDEELSKFHAEKEQLDVDLPELRMEKLTLETEKQTLENDIRNLEQRKENLDTEIQSKQNEFFKVESEIPETLKKANEQKNK